MENGLIGKEKQPKSFSIQTIKTNGQNGGIYNIKQFSSTHSIFLLLDYMFL